MPKRKGPGTYKGYKSPNTRGWPKPIRDEVRKTYGAWRSKHPGESHAIKTRGSRIAWSQARRRHPDLYRRHVHQASVRKEMKEHPEISKKMANQLVSDHEKRNKKELVGDPSIDALRYEYAR